MKRLSLVLFLLPAVSHAEVMDKEPSLFFLVATSLVLSVLAYLSARWRPWLLVAVLIVAALLLGGTAAETMSPDVGPAIAEEAGQLYVLIPWAGLIAVVVAAAVGLWHRRCAPNNSSKPTPLRGAA